MCQAAFAVDGEVSEQPTRPLQASMKRRWTRESEGGREFSSPRQLDMIVIWSSLAVDCDFVRKGGHR